MEESNADSFIEGDLVFAQSKGYIPWPGRLVGRHSRHGLVDFLGTDDSRRILYSKIWPYCDDIKSRFINRQNLEYPEFRDAILIAEKLSSGFDDNESGVCCYRVLKQEDLQEESDNRDSLLREKASQEDFGLEESSQKEARDEKPSQEELDQKEPFKENPSQEKPGHQEPSQEEPNHEKMVLEYVETLRSDRDSLEGGVEQKFIELVNVLRRSLKSSQQNYPSAVMALHELHNMTFSELLLVRNYEAVNSIYLLCYLNADQQNSYEAAEVRLLAEQLLSRFSSAFNLPDITSEFMDHFRSLSAIYRRFTLEFEPKQYQVAEESMVWEEPEQETMIVEELGQEAMVVESVELQPINRDSLNEGAEMKFDKLVDTLRRSLETPRKDYPSALLALEELLDMTFSKLFLLQKYKAVYFIYDLSRFGVVLPWNGLNKATQVRNLANKLMVRFFSVFQLPGITTYDFMVHFCTLYTSDTSDTESGAE